MPTIEVVVNKNNVPVDLNDNGTMGDLMKAINISEGIEMDKQVILCGMKEFRMPKYEDGKIAVFDGAERTVCDDKKISEFNIDGSEPVVCGALQEEWLEEIKWGAFGHSLYEADYLRHREYIVFNAQQQA
eukprot:CAMPEP_0180494690 /NCGR_PEP_ID=MMETSP1036_2-20121128/41371_1 /TAXON_ID=632150 /ORGANISM="Azadinium spinosum, Strain 3D9" /LENGTH=129 /DNA_ID=CAMNT_0022503143 /DNA_START=63 /DNA_END=452 /DNA_ORIENTATION=-